MAWLENTPLAELHLHLDGSLRLATARKLAAEAGVRLPERFHFTVGMGLAAALDLFAASLALLQRPAAVCRVASEICADAKGDGVTTLEIRFAPQLHGGAPIETIVDAALDGIGGRAGLILCGLYGEPPTVLGRLVEVAASRAGVVGIDLAGGPLPSHPFGLRDYAPAFRRAAELGLGRTAHLGEGRPPAEIATAVEDSRVQRVGHGTTVLDDPRVVDLLVARGVTLEACVTSNLHTGVIAAIAEHPLPRWLDRGLQVAVCADNTLFSQVGTREEHARGAAIPGMTPAKVATVVAAGHAAAFRRG